MKRNRQTGKKLVVVDFGRGSIKMALAETAGEAVRFRGITHVALPRAEDGSVGLNKTGIVERIASELKRHGWQGMPCAVLLSGSATSTQSFLFPPMPDKDLREAIALKLEETLHFDVAEAMFDFRRVREEEREEGLKSLTLVVAARKDAIEESSLILRRAGLFPIAVGAASESLANLTYYASLSEKSEATIHVDIGSDSTILNLFEGRDLRFSREVEIAGDEFTRALMRPILTDEGVVNLDHKQADALKIAAGYPREEDQEQALARLPHGIHAADILPLVEPVAQRLTAEIRRSIDYLRGILGRQEIDRIILSGSAGSMRNLDLVLEENLKTKVVYIDPVARATAHWRLAICDESSPSPAGFSAILGFSLGNHQPINLLRFEEIVRRVSGTRQALVPAGLALASSLALAAIPIGRTYDVAGELLQATSADLDRRLLEGRDLIAERVEFESAAQLIRTARGALPDWIGVMKELPAILPSEFQVTSLTVNEVGGALVLHLSALIYPGTAASDSTILRATTALSASPFFQHVHVESAARARADEPGHYEARLELLSEPLGPLRMHP